MTVINVIIKFSLIPNPRSFILCSRCIVKIKYTCLRIFLQSNLLTTLQLRMEIPESRSAHCSKDLISILRSKSFRNWDLVIRDLGEEHVIGKFTEPFTVLEVVVRLATWPKYYEWLWTLIIFNSSERVDGLEMARWHPSFNRKLSMIEIVKKLGTVVINKVMTKNFKRNQFRQMNSNLRQVWKD